MHYLLNILTELPLFCLYCNLLRCCFFVRFSVLQCCENFNDYWFLLAYFNNALLFIEYLLFLEYFITALLFMEYFSTDLLFLEYFSTVLLFLKDFSIYILPEVLQYWSF